MVRNASVITFALMLGASALTSSMAQAQSATDNGSSPAVATPAVVSPSVTVSGSGVIDSGSPTETPRVFRSGVGSTCGTPKTFPGTFSSGNFAYRTVTFTNTSNIAACYVITTNFPNGDGIGAFTTAYLGTFDPANIGTNYLGDPGTSSSNTSFGVNVPANGTVVVVVADTTNTTSNIAFTVGAPDPVPTLGEWALGGLVLALGGAGLIALRYRRFGLRKL